MRVLVVYATAGAGHFKAAEAVYNGIKSSTSHEVVLADVLKYSSSLFQKLYSSSYFFLISKFPKVWAVSFALLDIPALQPIVNFLRRVNNSLNTKNFCEFLIKEQFDVIVTTHFMPVEVVSALKRKGRIKSRLITVVTDYDVHRIWLGSRVDIYTAATEWTKEKLKSLGIEESKIKVTGIPTDSKFSSSKDVSALKQKFELKDGIFTVLIATGSFGIGPIEQVISALKGSQIIVVCGHNKSLFESLNAKKIDLVKVFPLVNNMDELMAVSDVMVTKPGGLSISEALVTGLPMIFFSAIPGQETNNIKVLAHYGVGAEGFTIQRIIGNLEILKSSNELLHNSQERCRKLSKPNAVSNIVSLI